jgi:hypothetical protein
MKCKHCGHNEYYIDGTFTRWVNSDHNTEFPLKITGELPAKCGECEKVWEESK